MRQKPTLNKAAVSTLILITLFATISASVIAGTQQAATPKEKADTLILLLQKANNTVIEVFHQLKAKNIDIPQASLNEYNQAVALVEESASLYEIGNYSQASNKIVQALQKLKETLTIIYETINLQQSESDIILEKTAFLNSSINRYYDQLKRIENLVNVTAAASLNTSSLEVDIATVKSLLDTASNNLRWKNFEAVMKNIVDAKNLVERLTQSLNTWAVELKTPRLETYINQTQTRLADIREEATSVSNVASITALDRAENSLNLAKDYLEKQLFNQTVTELMNAKKSEEQAVIALKPTATSSDFASVTGTSAVIRP